MGDNSAGAFSLRRDAARLLVRFRLLGLQAKIRSLRKFVVAPKIHIGDLRLQLAQ
jgi:hypothetical protein